MDEELFFTVGDCTVPLASRDFNLEALFLWIKFTLTALSKAEKALLSAAGVLSFLAFLTKVFKTAPRFSLRAVLFLSFLTFLIADLMIGMFGMVTYQLHLRKKKVYHNKYG